MLLKKFADFFRSTADKIVFGRGWLRFWGSASGNTVDYYDHVVMSLSKSFLAHFPTDAKLHHKLLEHECIIQV